MDGQHHGASGQQDRQLLGRSSADALPVQLGA
jgi:hypothetical protein